MESLRITEVARRTGIAATTLRYYDNLGLLPAKRLPNNHRRYGPDEIDRLRLIRACQALGCSLDEIRTIVVPGSGAARRASAHRNLAVVDAQLAQLAEVRSVLSHFAEYYHTVDEGEKCRETVRRVPTR